MVRNEILGASSYRQNQLPIISGNHDEWHLVLDAMHQSISCLVDGIFAKLLLTAG